MQDIVPTPEKKETPMILCIGGCGRLFKSKGTSWNRVCDRCNTRNSSLSRREAANTSKRLASTFEPTGD